ncbi:hypothetical protein TNCV_2460231 [Trichonephila clavipes]|nr:hypothetical protein TNCV_2460231 [Trichonephila clavipes]
MELATIVSVTSSHTPSLSMWPVSPKSVGSTASLNEQCNCILPGKCRINIKFLVKKSATKAFQILTVAYGPWT